MPAFRIGPVTFAVTGASGCDDLVATAQRCHEAFLTSDTPDLTVRLSRSKRSLDGPRLPLAERDGHGAYALRYLGWRGVYAPADGVAQVELGAGAPAALDHKRAESFVRAVIGIAVERAGGLSLHAAGLVTEGHAHVFYGPSGAGKTTIARTFASDALLSDDHVILAPAASGRWTAYATPYGGREGTPCHATSAPLATLAWLIQHPRLSTAPMRRTTAVGALLGQVIHVSTAPEDSATVLDRLAELARRVRCVELRFNRQDSIWTALRPTRPLEAAHA